MSWLAAWRRATRRRATWRRYVGTTLAVVTLSAGVAITSSAAAPAAATVASGGSSLNTYKLSGAVNGTLKDGPVAGCPYGGINNKGFIDLNDLVGSVSGLKGVASWGLDVNVKKNGTFSFKGLVGGDPNAELNVSLKDGNIAKGVLDNFFARSGTVTVKGESGSINADERDEWKDAQTGGALGLRFDGRRAGGRGVGMEDAGRGRPRHGDTAAPNFTSVSCPTTTFCAAVDNKGSVTLLQGRAGPRRRASIRPPPPTSTTPWVRSRALRRRFASQVTISTTCTPTTGRAGAAADQLNASVTSPTVSFAVSCPTTSFCMAVDGDFNGYTYNGSTWSAAQVIDPNSWRGSSSARSPAPARPSARPPSGNRRSPSTGPRGRRRSVRSAPRAAPRRRRASRRCRAPRRPCVPGWGRHRTTRVTSTRSTAPRGRPR